METFSASLAICAGNSPVTQNGRHFADDTFKPIFLNENIRISIEISLKFVPKVPINNNPTLVQIMAWGRYGLFTDAYMRHYASMTLVRPIPHDKIPLWDSWVNAAQISYNLPVFTSA